MKLVLRLLATGLILLCMVAQAQTVVKVLSLTADDGRPAYETPSQPSSTRNIRTSSYSSKG